MKLKNTSRKLHTFALLHDVVCVKSTCSCVEFPKRGTVHVYKVPGSITLSVGETLDVHPSVGDLPEVKAAVRRGEVALVSEPAPETKSGPGDEPAENARQGSKREKVRI